MLFAAQIGISIFGCAAFLLVTRETRKLQIAGTVCGLISNPFWWMMVIATEQWITIPLHAAYTYGWLSEAFRLWQASDKPVTEEDEPSLPDLLEWIADEIEAEADNLDYMIAMGFDPLEWDEIEDESVRLRDSLAHVALAARHGKKPDLPKTESAEVPF